MQTWAPRVAEVHRQSYSEFLRLQWLSFILSSEPYGAQGREKRGLLKGNWKTCLLRAGTVCITEHEHEAGQNNTSIADHHARSI